MAPTGRAQPRYWRSRPRKKRLLSLVAATAVLEWLLQWHVTMVVIEQSAH